MEARDRLPNRDRLPSAYKALIGTGYHGSIAPDVLDAVVGGASLLRMGTRQGRMCVTVAAYMGRVPLDASGGVVGVRRSASSVLVVAV